MKEQKALEAARETIIGNVKAALSPDTTVSEVNVLSLFGVYGRVIQLNSGEHPLLSPELVAQVKKELYALVGATAPEDEAYKDFENQPERWNRKNNEYSKPMSVESATSIPGWKIRETRYWATQISAGDRVSERELKLPEPSQTEITLVRQTDNEQIAA